MTKLTIKTGTTEEFFVRGRRLARTADRGEALPDERVVSFEDPAELIKLVSAGRLALFRAVKEQSGSITELARRMHRDRSSVKRDVDELERFGLVTVSSTLLPGHGRMKEVRATASRFRLQAEVA